MIIQEEGVWEPCTKEEFDEGWKKDPLFAPYRKVPIYHNARLGLLERLKLWDKEPDDWRYEKRIGKKIVFLINSSEANNKELMEFLKSLVK